VVVVHIAGWKEQPLDASAKPGRERIEAVIGNFEAVHFIPEGMKAISRAVERSDTPG
jgi:hypothetical protein